MDDINRIVMTFLLNAAWQIPLFAVVALLSVRLLRRTAARYRHWIWIVALGMSLGLPLWSVRATVSGEAGSWVAATKTIPMSTSVAMVEVIPSTIDVAAVDPVGVPAVVLTVTLFGYVAFLFGRTARLAFGWRQTRAIRKRAFAQDLGPLVDSATLRCERALGLRRVPILCSPDVPGPLTVGAIRPVVIVPPYVISFTAPEVVDSIVAHEMAHVRRRDFLRNLVIEVLYTPIAWHPIAAWIKRNIDATRELACDELVTTTVVTRSAYARSLVTVAASIPPVQQPGYSLGIVETGSLEQRIRALNHPPQPLRAAIASALLAVAVAVFVVAGTAASAFSVLAAQTSTPGDVAHGLVGTWRGKWEDVLVPSFTSSVDSSPIWLQFREENGRVVGTAWHDAIDLIDQPGTAVKKMQVFSKNRSGRLLDIVRIDDRVFFREDHEHLDKDFQYQLELQGNRAMLRTKDPKDPRDSLPGFRDWLIMTRQ